MANPKTNLSPAPASASELEHFHRNEARLEGIVARLWTYEEDVYGRLAIYDRYTSELPAKGQEETPSDGAGQPGARSRRKPHYVTFCLTKAQTKDGMVVSLQKGEHVQITGHLEDHAYSETLAKIWERLKKLDRRQSGDDEIYVGRSAVYVMVESLIRLS